MPDSDLPSASREETIRFAERAMAVACHLLEHKSVRRYDDSEQSLESADVSRAVGEQAIGLLIDLALDAAPVPADILLDRLRRYQLSARLHSEYLGNVEAASIIAFMVLCYEHAANAFVRDFGDDEAVTLVIARSATYVMKALRAIFAGELPSMNGVPTPRMAVMIELERRSPTNQRIQ